MEISDQSIQDLSNEIKNLREEINQLREIILPILELGKFELDELSQIKSEMESGNEVDYRSLITK